jgi:hypothetical protein
MRELEINVPSMPHIRRQRRARSPVLRKRIMIMCVDGWDVVDGVVEVIRISP